jgi:hypothetical protein
MYPELMREKESRIFADTGGSFCSPLTHCGEGLLHVGSSLEGKDLLKMVCTEFVPWFSNQVQLRAITHGH